MEYKPTSIIMPVLNQIDFTKRCIESILRNTSEEFEFIVINNASTDGTKEYLENLSNEDNRFIIINNAENVGVCKSWNQGIGLAKHDYVCIINNDIEILTLNWLKEFQKVLISDNKIRWVSPQTCYTPDKKLKYKKTHYEQLLCENLHGNHYVVGCCFYCPKKVFTDEIGFFDEEFEIRYYEDLDYLARILSSGYLVKMCIYAIVYHAVGITSRITKGGEDNEIRYNKKWGHTKYNMDYWRKN